VMLSLRVTSMPLCMTASDTVRIFNLIQWPDQPIN
jgi:hypothetical protein